MGNKKEEICIRDLRNGDRKVFDQIVNTYYVGLCSYAQVLTKDKALAEDIVQNVMVKLWVHKNRLKPDTVLRQYLRTLVYNQFIDEHRKRVKVIQLEKKHIEALDKIIDEEPIDFKGLMSVIEKEISALPPKCKRVFILSKKQGYSYIEIAEKLGLSVKTVENHMNKAYKLLNTRLSDKVKPFFFLLFGRSDVAVN